MVELTIVGLLLGSALSLHFRMFVLVPVMLFMFAVVAVGEGVRGETISWTEIASVLLAVQLGYFGGGILQYVFDEKPNREKLDRTLPQVDPAE